VRQPCRARGVRIIGDVPIYVAHDSAEVWANRELFHLDARGELPVREDWGGYRLSPEAWEFWQHRPNRLHDRFRYLPDAEGWRIERLGP